MLPRSSLLRLAGSAVLALALGACASTPKRPPPEVQWPPAPEVARVKFVRAFATAKDMTSGGFQNALRLVVPPSPDAVIQQPTGLALSVDEKRLYVTCSSVSRVLRADVERGTLDVVAEEAGKDPASPFGVAVDAEDRVYVGDMLRNEILVFDRDMKFLRKFTSERIDKPTGMAIDRRRQILYVVSGVQGKSQEHRVEVFSLAGQHLRTIGTRGHGPGQFNFPTHLTVGADGTLYVVDMLNFRVQAFDPEGALLGMFGTIGNGKPGTFNKAKGVALDAFGNVYVSDSATGNVQIFNSHFRVLLAFSGRAEARGYMLLPGAMTISSSNRIYVADFAAGAVHEFQLVNTSAEDSFGAPPAAGEGVPQESPRQNPQAG